jgi:hypothetical protein
VSSGTATIASRSKWSRPLNGGGAKLGPAL